MHLKAYMKSTLKLLPIFILIFAAFLAQGISANAQSRATSEVVNTAVGTVEANDVKFRTDFRAFMNASKWDGTDKEKLSNASVDKLEVAIGKLREQFAKDPANWWKARGDIRPLVTTGKSVDKIVRRYHLPPKIEITWRQLRDSINKLAYYYETNDI